MQEKRIRGFWILGIVLILVVTGGLLLAFRSASREEVDGIGVNEIATVLLGDLSASATATGHVMPAREVMLSASAPGLVQAVFVRVGDQVSQGDPMIRLDTTDLALNVSIAEQNLRLAQARLADLLEEPGQYEIISAEADVTNAQVRCAR